MNEPTTHLSSEALQAFLEGELPADRIGEAESHLAACHRCASELEGWRVLLADLSALPELGPSDTFRDRVMAEVPTRPSLARRLADRTRRAFGAGMDAAKEHPTPERIQDLLDGALGSRGRRGVLAHLDGCTPCREAVREWEGVFASLRSVPRLAPSEGFAERVMDTLEATRAPAPAPASVDPRPAWGGLLAAARRRLTPSTRRGWALVALFVSLPTAGVLAAVGAVIAHPLLTMDGLATFLGWRLADGLQVGFAWATERMLQSPLLAWLWETAAALLADPALALSGMLALWAVSLAAGWVLYRHLIAPLILADRHV